MFIAPREGYRMKSWSLETYVPPTTPCPGKYVDRGCYFVFYARGFGEGKFAFWIELQVRKFIEIRLLTECAINSCHFE